MIRDVTLHHSGGGVFAIRKGDWKLIHECEQAGYYEAPEPGAPGQLYNLRHDPGEQNNLFAEEPERVRQLTADLIWVQKGGCR